MSTRNVVVFGKGHLAVFVAEWLHHRKELRAVVPVAQEPDWTMSLRQWALDHDIPIGMTLLWGKADLAVSILYDRIFPPVWLSLFKRAVNFHPGPLPAYRGCNPVNWALKNGETEHAVTLHEIDAGIDTGPILAEARFPIYPEDEVRDLYFRSMRYGKHLLFDSLSRLDSLTPRPQVGKGRLYQIKDRARLGDRLDWTRELTNLKASYGNQGFRTPAGV